MARFIEAPRVERNPNPKVPLVAMVYYKADGADSTVLEIDDGRIGNQSRILGRCHTHA